MDNSISCFEIFYWTPWIKWKTLWKRSFFIRGLEVGEMIPFPVWIIPFPFFENLFWTPWIKWETSYKRTLLIKGVEVEKTILYPVWIIPFQKLILTLRPKKKYFEKHLLEVGEIILFTVWIIPFPVLKTSLWTPWIKWEIFYKKNSFDQSPGSGSNNSISCVDNSNSCFQNEIWAPMIKWAIFIKEASWSKA